MKDKIFHLVASCLSLTISIVLIIFVSFAWYTNNQSTSALGPGGIVSDDTIINTEESIFLHISDYDETTNTYTIGETIEGMYEFDLQKFDILNDSVRHEELLVGIKIDQIPADKNYRLYSNTLNQVFSPILTATGPYPFSDIISISYVPGLSLDSGKVLGDNLYTKTFVTISDVQDSKVGKIDLLPSDVHLTSNTIFYFLFDFNDIALEKIYNLNLGSEVLNQRIKFSMDFSIFAEEVKL